MRKDFILKPYEERVFELKTGVQVAIRSWNPNNHNPVKNMKVSILIEERSSGL